MQSTDCATRSECESTLDSCARFHGRIRDNMFRDCSSRDALIEAQNMTHTIETRSDKLSAYDRRCARQARDKRKRELREIRTRAYDIACGAFVALAAYFFVASFTI